MSRQLLRVSKSNLISRNTREGICTMPAPNYFTITKINLRCTRLSASSHPPPFKIRAKSVRPRLEPLDSHNSSKFRFFFSINFWIGMYKKIARFSNNYMDYYLDYFPIIYIYIFLSVIFSFLVVFLKIKQNRFKKKKKNEQWISKFLVSSATASFDSFTLGLRNFPRCLFSFFSTCFSRGI